MEFLGVSVSRNLRTGFHSDWFRFLIRVTHMSERLCLV